MADIPGNIDKLNDIEIASNAPITETLMNKIGANINQLIDLAGIASNSQEFTANGVFNVPEGVTSILVEAIGGGGGGAEGDAGIPGGGGASASREFQLFTVTPLAALSVGIGAGGTGGAAAGSQQPSGTAGGNTAIDGFVVSRGAPGGQGNRVNDPNLDPLNTAPGVGGRGLIGGGNGGSGSGSANANGYISRIGQASAKFDGGTSPNSGDGGGGAASYYGAGGNGATGGGAAGSPAATAYGAGGGGGGGNGGVDVFGAAGASGYMKIYW
jgi:hypothetical protein